MNVRRWGFNEERTNKFFDTACGGEHHDVSPAYAGIEALHPISQSSSHHCIHPNKAFFRIKVLWVDCDAGPWFPKAENIRKWQTSL